jgi:hypothetical protein
LEIEVNVPVSPSAGIVAARTVAIAPWAGARTPAKFVQVCGDETRLAHPCWITSIKTGFLITNLRRNSAEQRYVVASRHRRSVGSLAIRGR